MRCSSTTPTAPTRARRSPWPGSPRPRPRPTPIGIFREVQRPVYHRNPAAEPASEAQLADLLMAGDTWTVA